MNNTIEMVQKRILGIIFNYPNFIYQPILLRTCHFVNIEYKIIYDTMLELMLDNIEIDSISVYDKIKKNNKKCSLTTIIELSAYLTNPASIMKDIFYLIEKYMMRQLIQLGNNISKMDPSNDPFEIVQKTESELFNITQQAYKQHFKNNAIIFQDTLLLLNDIKTKGIDYFLVSTGFTDLNKLIGGFKKSDLIILAGRPSMGKSALALSMAIRCKKKVGFFSLEMSTTQLSMRTIAMETGISVDTLLAGYFSATQFDEIKQMIPNTNLFIDDTANCDIFEIISKAKKLKIQQNIDLLVIDYLQLCHDRTEQTREREIASISVKLKGLAKELDIPILCLSQMNRSVESRADKKPLLSDIRESGAVEQDADIVMFIYRPEVYGIEYLADGTSTNGFAQLLIKKNRNGAIGDVNLTFIKHKTLFENYNSYLPACTTINESTHALAGNDKEQNFI